MQTEILSFNNGRECTHNCVHSLTMLLVAAFVFGSGLPPARGQQAQQIKLYNGKMVSADEYKQTLALIEQIVARTRADAYRKYSDESVAYVGNLLQMRYGIIPAVNTSKMLLIDHGYRVCDVMEEGCRIVPNPNKFMPAEREVFVTHLRGSSDRQYANILMLRISGSFTYKTVAGGSRTIPKYELGKRISKEDYLAALQGKQRVKESPKSTESQIEVQPAKENPLKK